MPSAAQKRLAAKGRSADAQTTTVPSRSAALLLNSRTDAAHTPVSMLGKTLRTTRLPVSDWLVTSERSAPVRTKAGASVPGAGSSPTVETGSPWK